MKPNQANATGGLLANEDVQKLMKVIEGLLNGSKKLVIVSEATPDEVLFNNLDGTGETRNLVHYKHTFKVEDVQ